MAAETMTEAAIPIARDSDEPGSASDGTRQSSKKSHPMRKIFFLVVVAIAVFMAFTAYNIHMAAHGRVQLAAIKDLYFPVLQRADANSILIDKIADQYLQAVELGDRELIDKASEIGAQADKDFAEIGALYPARSSDISTLRADLEHYQDLARQNTVSFLEHAADTTQLTQGMNQALARLRQELRSFRQSSYDNFTQTLSESQHDAKSGTILGLAIGAMNLGFMGVLVYFIRNNMRMMTLIAEQNATLEHRVAERTAELSRKTSDINAMLQNMKLGVSTVIPGNRIHPEYSYYLRTIFSIDDLAGRDLVRTLFGKSSLGVDAKDQIAVALGAILGEEAMMFDFNSHLLPGEICIAGDDGTQKIVQLDWTPIVGDHGTVEKVLLISQDVTHLRELEESSAHQKEELEIVAKIIQVAAGKFNEFVETAGKYLAENRRLIVEATGRDADTIAALFRNMHTIKGNARTYEFTHITNAAHCAEQTYDALRKDSATEWNAGLIGTELDAVDAAVAQYVKVNEDTLGRKGRASDLLTARGAFVGSDQLAELRSMTAALAAAHPAADMAQMRKTIDQLGLVALSRIASGSVDSLSSLAGELKKPTPSVEIMGADVAFNTQFAETLKSCCMHIFRNSLDHGIEAPEDRTRALKPAQGKIRLACERHGDRVELRVGDDGRGLALHKLHEKGLASGLFSADDHPTRSVVADIIFCSGLSTAAQVTQVSGRGVGMDAVRTFLRAQGAAVRIALSEPSGTEMGYAPFEFVIDVPTAAFSH
jgi:HPt (histidine-containing phosphotransfer) domain-containing protein